MSTFHRNRERAQDHSRTCCEQTLSGTATTGDPTGRRHHPHLQQTAVSSQKIADTDMNGPAMRESEVLVLGELPC